MAFTDLHEISDMFAVLEGHYTEKLLFCGEPSMNVCADLSPAARVEKSAWQRAWRARGGQSVNAARARDAERKRVQRAEAAKVRPPRVYSSSSRAEYQRRKRSEDTELFRASDRARKSAWRAQ